MSRRVLVPRCWSSLRPAAKLVVLVGLVIALGSPSLFSQTPSPAASPLDRPLRLIAEARKSFENVQDYTATLVKREQVNGQLLPENVIALKVRNQPFSIHMRWLKPKALEGQEACYVAGRNNGMMRVKPPGMLGAMGFLNLDPRAPQAQQMSRHSITEAGIGNVIERFAQRWESERQTGKTRVRIGEFEFSNRKCVRVESSHPGSKPGDYYAYRILIYFDKETHLPIRTECYDWPKEGGKPEGDLLECFSFTDLKLNVGLTDEAFNY
jgi:hypothetical protein